MLTSVFVLLSAALASTATAYTKPQGDNPSGNPISKPTLHEVVPAGTPYDITWQPTSEGSVTLLLLRGPSTNVVPLYPIVETIPNTGSYSWTPAMDLEADTTGYGIQIIQDSNGAYQYSTQFGISGSTGSDSTTSAASMPHIEYKNSTTNGTASHHVSNSTVTVNGTCATVCAGYHNTTSTTETVLPTTIEYGHQSNTTLFTTAVTTRAAQSTPAEVVATGTGTTSALPVLSTGAASHLTVSFLAGAAGLVAFML